MKIEFFHDVVCGWCYIQSPVLRAIQAKIDVKVVHRNFILQRNDREMISKWGSLEGAKEQILQHWESCSAFEGKSDRFNIDGMREADFHYPNGLIAAQATKAAEILGGQEAHWDMFDVLQRYHLQEAKNVGDIDVVKEAITELDYEPEKFLDVMFSENVKNDLNKNSLLALNYGVRSIPTLVVDSKYLIRSTTKYQDLVNTLVNLGAVNLE
ncbi:DsbA family oxidoreductase [Vibrio hangzhouensis]|uniref:Predicted dithiol-disulfide isomerase, DsbA family n=1 Tax=Vibrio hangzhouensis TaxID=462991 RepID=A0A1H6CPZ1_9VIBR|nr:DsbA family protein [Vibrio hangzhouensis]SEG75051.1 Predicted dithiol-disulfide isomerase, DsbA family [Vibrio hangzhouensis]